MQTPSPDELYRRAGLIDLTPDASLDEIHGRILRLTALLAASRADRLTWALLRAAAAQRLRSLGFTPAEAARVMTAALDAHDGIRFETFMRVLARAEDELGLDATNAQGRSDG